MAEAALLETMSHSDEEVVATPRSRKKRASRYDMLEERCDKIQTEMSSNFGHMSNQMDQLLGLITQRSDNGTGKPISPQSQAVRPTDCSISPRRARSVAMSDNTDCISLHAPDTADSDSGSDIEVNKDARVNQTLTDIFGTQSFDFNKQSTSQGLQIDSAQEDLLKTSFRTKEPSFLTAFNEETFDKFPVNDNTATILTVPSLDTLVGDAITKKYGPKNTAKGRFSSVPRLHSQPLKQIEQVAYKGHQAGRLAIVTQLYTQQALAKLLLLLESNDFDKCDAISQLKDIFDISTKSLDQIGRTSAFHHIIRRSCALNDCGWFESDANGEMANLPLTSEGVFGSELEPLLKARRERRKHVQELLPECKSFTKDRKRKDHAYNSLPDSKRHVVYAPSASATLSSAGISETPADKGTHFRIPKLSKTGQSSDKGSSRGNFGRGRGRGGPSGRSYWQSR